jgi:glutamate receptor, ionotropic, plant
MINTIAMVSCILQIIQLLPLILISGLFLQAFPRGSPLTPEISREILKLASSSKMAELEKQLYHDTECPDKDDSQTSSSLTLQSFLGLFIITGASSFLALTLHAAITLYSNWHDLISGSSQSSWQRWFSLVSKIFHDSHGSNDPDKDEPKVTSVGRTTDSPQTLSDHIIENFDSYSDIGSPPEGEGTPGRQVSVHDPDPLSFAYMCSEGLE